MTPSRLFGIRYQELGTLIESKSNDALINLPLVLRQLLADSSPLVHQVNREHKLKIRFTIGLSARERSEEMASMGLPVPKTHLLGALPPNERKREVNLDQLLAFEVAKIEGNYYSASQLLDACANKLGGVHYDPHGKTEAAVRDITTLGNLLEQMGMGSFFGVLILLARVTHAGLSSLYGAISEA